MNNTTNTGHDPIIFIPSFDDVSNLKVGDKALDCFGRLSLVTEISYRGVDVKGKPYVGFYTETGPTSQISGSYKAGELVRTVPLSNKYTSAECDRIEQACRR